MQSPMKRESNPIPSSSSTSENFNDIDSTATSPSPPPPSRPSRILYFKNNVWVDFDRQVFDELSDGFVQNKPVLQVSIDGKDFIFNFPRMCMMDTSTKVETSTAWIDEKGRCFFPKIVIEEKRRAFIDTTELLPSEDRWYKVVERLFLVGMRRVGKTNVNVTNIYKCLYLGKLGRLRLERFNLTMTMTKMMRGGDGNVRYGWYGSSVERVEEVVKHGFGRSNEGELREGDAHGVGVHLASPHFPYYSSLLSEPDEGDERHIVLCRVIMGSSEEIEAGSLQRHPSTDEFDSGVDDLANPKWYVVWNTHMNTHILPEYIIAFKTSSDHPSPPRLLNPAPLRSRRVPLRAPGLSFQRLFAEMGRSLPNSKMQDLEMIYGKFRGGKMSRDEFIRHLRSLAGDKLIASTIRGLRGQLTES